jgi:ATP-dependent helicase/DNAse subunit B
VPITPLRFGSYGELAADIADRLITSRAGDPLAPWQEEVIIASAGVAEAIDRHLLDRSGSTALRSANHTLEWFAASVVNAAGEFPRVANDAERRLAMRTAARAVADPLMETRGTAAMLERTYRDIRDSGLTLRELARKAAAAPLRNRERMRTLVRAWEEYERLIAKLGCIDPADLLARAAELIATGATVPPQMLAGFYDMTGAQMALVGALRAVERLAAVYVPVDPNQPRAYAFAHRFVQHFVSSPVSPRPSPLLLEQPQWTIREQKTREEEIAAVCRAVRQSLDAGVAAGDIGIVARSLDPYDLHLFERFARESGFSTTSAPSIPLVAHRIGRAVTMLLGIRDRDFPRSEVLEIVRGGLEVKTRINVDKADADTRTASIAGGPSAALRNRTFRSLPVADYIEVVAELEELTERIDGRLIARLADAFRIDCDADVAACAALDAIADLLIRAEKWKRPADPASILDAIQQVVISTAGEDAGRPTVWLGDVMSFRGRTFEHLFAVRLQDDVVPQRRNEDPLLLDSDRRLTGVREIGNGRDEEQLLFQLVRGGSSSHVHFSYASSDGFGKPLRPSHYLKTFALEQRPDEKKAILKQFSRWVKTVDRSPLSVVEADHRQSDVRRASDTPPGQRSTVNAQRSLQRADHRESDALRASDTPPGQRSTVNAQRSLQLLSRAGRASEFDGYIASAMVRARARRALESISPTQLEDFGECPQKFLMKHILRVRDIDDPEREVQINHREKGIVDHGILERFYRSLTAGDIAAAAPLLPRLSPAVEQRLETIIEEAFDELERRAPAHNTAMRSIERRATLRVLRNFIATDLADLVARGLTPAHFEYRFGKKHREHQPDHPEPFIVDVGGVALRVEGTIDRIDRGGDVLRIVDYKSGKALRHEDLADKIDRGVRLQLPLYAMAAADFFRIDPADVRGAIKPIAATDTAPEKFAFSLGEKHERLGQTLHIFVDAILRGAFPAFPSETDREFNSCKYCPVNHSCRTRHDTEQRRAILDAGEPRTLLTSPR